MKNAVKKNRPDKSAKTANGKATANGKNEPETKRSYQNGVADGITDESDDQDVSVEKGELEASEKSGEKRDEQDVVFIQDVGFNVKIQSPGTEVFEIQVRIIYLF